MTNGDFAPVTVVVRDKWGSLDETRSAISYLRHKHLYFPASGRETEFLYRLSWFQTRTVEGRGQICDDTKA